MVTKTLTITPYVLQPLLDGGEPIPGSRTAGEPRTDEIVIGDNTPAGETVALNIIIRAVLKAVGPLVVSAPPGGGPVVIQTAAGTVSLDLACAEEARREIHGTLEVEPTVQSGVIKPPLRRVA